MFQFNVPSVFPKSGGAVAFLKFIFSLLTLLQAVHLRGLPSQNRFHYRNELGRHRNTVLSHNQTLSSSSKRRDFPIISGDVFLDLIRCSIACTLLSLGVNQHLRLDSEFTDAYPFHNSMPDSHAGETRDYGETMAYLIYVCP